jgi:hypothetical protein
VRQFLDDFKKLPLVRTLRICLHHLTIMKMQLSRLTSMPTPPQDSLSPAEAMQRMKGMRERLMSHNNPFVLTLLSAQQSA